MKNAVVNLRVKPATKQRLEALAQVTRRTKSFLVEEALETYLEVNEWQTRGIIEALAEADRPEAEWTDHAALKAKWEAKRDKLA